MDIFDNVIFVGVPGMDQLSGLDKGQLSSGKIASFSCLKRSWFFFLYDIRVAPKVHSILLGSKAALQQIATSLVLWAKYYMPGNNCDHNGHRFSVLLLAISPRSSLNAQ